MTSRSSASEKRRESFSSEEEPVGNRSHLSGGMMRIREQVGVGAALARRNTEDLARGDSMAIERHPIGDVAPTGRARVSHWSKSLSDTVIGLREWGTRRVFSLRAPQHARETVAPDTAPLQLTRSDLAVAAGEMEIVYEGPAWRIRDRAGEMSLKQDGRPTREASLMSGTEITIAGRTFIAESARSIA
jgi:hypothetical protein